MSYLCFRNYIVSCHPYYYTIKPVFVSIQYMFYIRLLICIVLLQLNSYNKLSLYTGRNPTPFVDSICLGVLFNATSFLARAIHNIQFSFVITVIKNPHNECHKLPYKNYINSIHYFVHN